ncbi:MAG TPA: DUF1571 domain-containing protein [Pirellulales bacterium]|jgi:hypothetical protein|nr:DUF1571 domain-containing protein [Pirellulales bacterium]
MKRGKWLLVIGIGSATLVGASASMWAQSPGPAQAGGRPGREQLPQPVYRVPSGQGGAQAAGPATPGQQPTSVAANTNNALPQQPEAVAQPEHPLVPALQIAYAALNNIRTNIRDYSCTMTKRERIDGKLNDMEFLHLRVRHEPFSVYMYFLGPERLRGQEAMYVANKNAGNLLGHAGSGVRKLAGTVQLAPTGVMAMAGQRYPITEIGMLNLTKRLIEVAEQDKMFGECDVKFFKGAKINNRTCLCIKVVHPVPRKNFRFHEARVYVDDELNLPVRYEAYDWPERQGGPPLLLEEYTYTDIKINQGFTDQTFDEYNPEYHFH